MNALIETAGAVDEQPRSRTMKKAVGLKVKTKVRSGGGWFPR
jgi:hypothetical protein